MLAVARAVDIESRFDQAGKRNHPPPAYAGGIESGNANAARRTFAVNLHRQGRSPKLIQQLIGVSSLAAVKRLVDNDPATLASVVRGVI